MAGGFTGNPERMIVYGALEYRPSLPGLLGQVRIRGGWREVEWQKASVLELVSQERKCREKRKRERERRHTHTAQQRLDGGGKWGRMERHREADREVLATETESQRETFREMNRGKKIQTY